MGFERFIVSFSPVVLFYIVYYRYFSSGRSGTKYVTSLLSGICYALFLLLSGSLISSFISGGNPLVSGFILAGLIEKAGAVIFIYALFRRYPSFTITTGTITGMFFGLGFSCVENIFYGAESSSSVIYIRIIFSVPLHITTCGIAGFYLGIGKLSGFRPGRVLFYVKSIAVPLMFHGIFDFFLLMGGFYAYASAPVLIISVVFLEIILARSKTMFSGAELRIMGMHFEEWRVRDRQPRYDRWVKRYTGILKSRPAPLFNWNPGVMTFLFVFIMISAAALGFPLYRYLEQYRGLSLHQEEVVAVFVLFPLCIALALIISGIINPQFFVRSLMSLPVISDVEMLKNGQIDEYLVTNDLTRGNCFLQTTEALGLGHRVSLKFSLSSLSSDVVDGTVIWENHSRRNEAFGSIIRFNRPYRGFSLFILRYSILRLWKGAVFLFRLPGFDALKGLFYKPLVISQQDLYLKAGDIIFREDEAGDRCYMIKKGRVIFFKKKGEDIITVNTAVTGEVFGELVVLGNQKTRNTSAICASDCILAVATKENLDVLLLNNQDFTFNLIETLTNRLILSEKIFFENIKELEHQKMDNERLAHMAVILILSAIGFGSGKKDGGVHMDINMMLRYIRKMDETDIAVLTNLMMKKQMAGGNNEELEMEVGDTLSAMFTRLEEDAKQEEAE